jgi:hypothetical protein
MMATQRDYPVTHCDDRHQATGGPVWGFAVQGPGHAGQPLPFEGIGQEGPAPAG